MGRLLGEVLYSTDARCSARDSEGYKAASRQGIRRTTRSAIARHAGASPVSPLFRREIRKNAVGTDADYDDVMHAEEWAPLFIKPGVSFA